MKDLFLITFFYSFIIQIKSLDLEKIRADILDNHNYHRKKHHVDNLIRNKEIESVAQEYSEYLASINEMKHSKNVKYGENLYSCYPSGRCLNGEKASEKWYSEVKDYNYNNPNYKDKIGHFTQLVWKGSNEIGCGAACNNDNICYVTCNYYPPGNIIGEFQDNVFPLKDSDNKNGITTKIIIFIIAFILLIVFIPICCIKRKKPMNDLNVYLVK